MQDEVSALKAENEQQKREIQELREMVLAMAANKKQNNVEDGKHSGAVDNISKVVGRTAFL